MRHHTRWLLWLLALAVAVGFALLGHWQLQRMHEKQALLAQAAQVRTRTWSLDEALRQPGALHWVRGEIELDAPRILLDNQMREGRAGVHVYQLARSAHGARLLVDLGWLALPADRHLPAIAPIAGRHVVEGLLAPPPSAGLALGPPMVAAELPGTWLATRLEPAAVAQALQVRDISSQVLRLDPALPLGYARDLDLLPNTLPPARHLAYAVQWFGLALAVIATAVLLEVRGRRKRRAGAESRAVRKSRS